MKFKKNDEPHLEYIFLIQFVLRTMNITSESLCYMSMLCCVEPHVTMPIAIQIMQKYKNMYALCTEYDSSFHSRQEQELYEKIRTHLCNDSIIYMSMLHQIPGISLKVASDIIDRYETMDILCKAIRISSEELCSIIGDVLGQRIYSYLFYSNEKSENSESDISSIS